MQLLRLGARRWRIARLAAIATVIVGMGLAWLLATGSVVRATSGGDPYSTPDVADTNPDPNIVETTLTAQAATVDLGNGVTAHAETFNGSIPGPTFHLKVGDTVIVHFQNNLGVGTGIHWHGVELNNESDGTPFTQNAVPPGGSFLYKFTVTRPGIFWYHPHHDPTNDTSTNQVFAGMYGEIIVADPNEAKLQQTGTLPPAADTRPVVLSDTTVCKSPGPPSQNDTDTYPNRLNQGWTSNPNGAPPTTVQADPTPVKLCEAPTAVDGGGNARPSYAAGDIPAIQSNAAGRENEGQTVLTNGKNVGARAGYPAAPGALAAGASLLNVRPGQGLRLEIVNAAAIRYMRLRLTDNAGTLIPLIRVGGEGGLLDNAVEEGGVQVGGFDPQYDHGEILLPPGSRADVVVAIPAAASGVLTMWTEDFQRAGPNSPGFYTHIPTVPVMHLNVTGSPLSPAYSISDGTPLRANTGDPVPVLGPATGTYLDPAAFSPAKPGIGPGTPAITFVAGGNTVSVNGFTASHDIPNYETAPHPGSARYVKVGDTLELSVSNQTNAHHPFHMHGFSIQPLTLTKAANPTFTWLYHEFRDNVDIPAGYTLTFRVRIDDRPLPDGTTAGGALGRWLFHCHIFFHATLGMLSEFVVVPANGKERPDINVNATQVNVNQGQTATVKGSYFDVDGEPVALSSSVGSMHDDGGGNFTWSFPTGTASSQFVYLTATNKDGTKGQIPFFLHITELGGPTLTVPGSQSGRLGSSLSFGVSATDPDAAETLALGASGLPGALKFTDNHNRTGGVSGKLTAKPGKYTASFSASDGIHPAVSKTVQITIIPPELSVKIARSIRVSKGTISVGCVVLSPILRTCKVTVFVGRKKVGSATVRIRRRGKRSTTVKIKLNAQTLRKIAHARKGIKVTLSVEVTEFGTKTVFKTSAQTNVLAAKKKKH